MFITVYSLDTKKKITPRAVRVPFIFFIARNVNQTLRSITRLKVVTFYGVVMCYYFYFLSTRSLMHFVGKQTRRSSRVFVEGPGDGGADHAPPVGTAVPRPGVRRLPGVHQNQKGTSDEVSMKTLLMNETCPFIGIKDLYTLRIQRLSKNKKKKMNITRFFFLDGFKFEKFRVCTLELLFSN